LATIRKVLVTLNQILNFAVQRNYAKINPLQATERPKANNNRVKEIKGDEAVNVSKTAVQALTPEQANALLTVETHPKYNTLFRLAVFAGLRQEELLGLRWQDIDWQASQIHVRRTYYSGRFFEPKTPQSRRRVDIGLEMLRRLKQWRLACPANKLNLVFPNEAGNPMNNTNMVRRHFKPALKAAGLPDVKFHTLRHIYASLLIDQGENIKYIQTQLGHSSPMVTLKVYAHKLRDTNPEAACRLEATVYGSKMVAATENRQTTNGLSPRDDTKNKGQPLWLPFMLAFPVLYHL